MILMNVLQYKKCLQLWSHLGWVCVIINTEIWKYLNTKLFCWDGVKLSWVQGPVFLGKSGTGTRIGKFIMMGYTYCWWVFIWLSKLQSAEMEVVNQCKLTKEFYMIIKNMHAAWVFITCSITSYVCMPMMEAVGLKSRILRFSVRHHFWSRGMLNY